MRRLILMGLLGLLAAAAASARQEYAVAPVALGLNTPVRMAFAPDGSGRLFYLELVNGNVMVMNGSPLQNGTWLHLPVDANGERGLLGIAFDSAFASNHWLYLYHTMPGSPPHNVVERYTEVSFRGDTSSRLLLYDQPVSTPCGTYTNHNAGALLFGSDGKLYISVGENNCPLLSEMLNGPRGKILRVEPGVAAPLNAVTTNPFYDDGDPSTGNDDRIYVRGLRNSFGMTYNAPDGMIYASENGPDCNDEVNRITAGHDYGWRDACNTGVSHCSCAQDSPYTAPLWHLSPTIAPTGITVYHGSLFPELEGKVIIVDNNAADVRAGTFNAARDSLTFSIISHPGAGALFDVVTTPDGNIYLCAADGIRKLVPTSTSAPPGPARPAGFSLAQNYPDPFNPSTSIAFSLDAGSFVTLTVTDLLGREAARLVNHWLPAGGHEARWDASMMPAGVYYYRLAAGGRTITRSMILAR